MIEAPKIRVWWIPQVPAQGWIFHREVKTVETAYAVFNALADYDLFLLKANIREDFSNAGGVEVFENGEWIDIESSELAEGNAP